MSLEEGEASTKAAGKAHGYLRGRGGLGSLDTQVCKVLQPHQVRDQGSFPASSWPAILQLIPGPLPGSAHPPSGCPSWTHYSSSLVPRPPGGQGRPPRPPAYALVGRGTGPNLHHQPSHVREELSLGTALPRGPVQSQRGLDLGRGGCPAAGASAATQRGPTPGSGHSGLGGPLALKNIQNPLSHLH